MANLLLTTFHSHTIAIVVNQMEAAALHPQQSRVNHRGRVEKKLKNSSAGICDRSTSASTTEEEEWEMGCETVRTSLLILYSALKYILFSKQFSNNS